jgi:hypothetical protein
MYKIEQEYFSKPQKTDRRGRDFIRNAKRYNFNMPGIDSIKTGNEHFKTCNEVQKTLKYLISEQKNDKNFIEDRIKVFKDGNSTEIIQEFKKTPSYKKILHQSKKIFSEPGLTDEKTNEYLNDLSGELYNELAYHGMAARMSSRGLVLSPERTTLLYDEFYPDRKAYYPDRPFNKIGLKNTSKPNSVLINDHVNNPEVIGILDFMARSKNNQHIVHKYNIFTRQLNELNQRYPELVSKNAKIIFVTPSTIDGNIPLSKVAHEKNAEFPAFPISYSNFGQLMDETKNTISLQSIKIIETTAIFLAK